MIRSVWADNTGQIHIDPDQSEWGNLIDSPTEGFLWVDMTDDHPDCAAILRNIFRFHALSIDDALTETHIPKIDDWGDYIYIVLASFDIDSETLETAVTEVDIFLGSNYLVTFHQRSLRCMDESWNNTLKSPKAYCSGGPDRLLYRIADNMADDLMEAMDIIDFEIDASETAIFADLSNEILSKFLRLKRALLEMRRLLTPSREVMNRLARDDYSLIEPVNKPYYRDVYDHFVRMVDINENLRDLVQGAMDTYLSLVSNRLSEVMKTLTIVTLLFMPLTFLTGFFGMNFFGEDTAISVHGLSGYLFGGTLILLAFTPLAMLVLLRRKDWL